MKSIIVIDDDPGVRDAFTYIFDASRFEVSIYPDGIGIINNEYAVPDIYILDKQLPGIDGLDICRFLKTRQTTGHIPVIVLSANPNIKKLALAAGADAALEKPFAIAVLRSSVERLIAADVK